VANTEEDLSIVLLENREQRTENREQRTENREQRTENREPVLACSLALTSDENGWRWLG
jgi:hypothetical protein